MKVRLVAYKKGTGVDVPVGSEQAFQLDLENQPNIALNLQFADIKEPAKRQGGFSQTFKLPFTEKNDQFFNTWYNVNLTSQNPGLDNLFSTRQRYAAVLFVGTVPQFEGFLQLKAVYLKAQLYEVTLMAATSNMFINIGNRALQDICTNQTNYGGFNSSQVEPSNRYNHIISEPQIKASWEGTSNSFVNINGDSLRDTVANVQKIMYPLSVTNKDFKFRAASNEYLDMSQDDIDNEDLYPNDEDAIEKAVNITNLRPAMQVKEIFTCILAQAGFSYTSSYLTGEYFSKIFMTTGGHVSYARPPIVGWGGETTNQVVVGSSTGNSWGYVPQWDPEEEEWIPLNTCQNVNLGDLALFGGYNWRTIRGNTVTPVSDDYDTPNDPLDIWFEDPDNDEGITYFTKTDANMNSVNVRFIFYASGIMTCGTAQNGGVSDAYNTVSVMVGAFRVDNDTNAIVGDAIDLTTNVLQIQQGGVVDSTLIESNLWLGGEGGEELGGVPIGSKVCFRVKVIGWERKINSDGTPQTVNIICGANYGSSMLQYMAAMRTLISISWTGYGANVYGRQVDMYEALGSEIKQKDWMRDMIERFNLVIVPDPANPDNLIIEPYTEYLAGGDIKDWTHKLDLSKERVVRDTSSLQKRDITMTDLEDVDLMNRAIKEETQHLNVYGKIGITVRNNEFARGEYKNHPVFAPYINQKVFQGEDDQEITHLRNMPVQYEWTTTKVEGGYEKVLEQTKPKLFYYPGSPLKVLAQEGGTDDEDAGQRYYLHQLPLTGTPIAYKFTEFPLCTPFEMIPDYATGEAEIVPSTRSLYWNQNGPVCGQLKAFKWSNLSPVPVKSLYETYWFTYFNTIYHTDSRLMECYLNLDPVDMLNFKFSDQIFIKDAYWSVQKIQNYQVGQQVSTKVTLLKQTQVYAMVCAFADYVVGELGESNLYLNFVYYWCPKTDPNCTPSLSLSDNYSGIMTDEASCECIGGNFQFVYPDPDSGFTPPFEGAGICKPNTGSPNLRESNRINYRSIYSNTNEKSILSGRLGGIKAPFVIGTDTSRYSKPLVPKAANDFVIKYKNTYNRALSVQGESHKVILAGTTTGTTAGYAYPEGDPKRRSIQMPEGTNMTMSVKVISTVVGGTSTTCPKGSTEALNYVTAFTSTGSDVSQVGFAGGERTSYVKDTVSVMTALEILPSASRIEFKLKDTDPDVTRVWQLTVEYEINRIPSLAEGYGNDYAIYQNGSNIQLENFAFLLWN